MSHTSSMEKEHTVAPRFGVISTSPSASSMVRAWRTGVLLTPSRSASCSSIKRSPGPYSPVRIKPRNRSKAPAGRAPFPVPRTTRPTQTPAFDPRRPLVYNLRRPPILCQEFQEREEIPSEAALAPSPPIAPCGTRPTSWDSWPCRRRTCSDHLQHVAAARRQPPAPLGEIRAEIPQRYRLVQQADPCAPLHVF